MSRRRAAPALDALTWAIVAVSLLPIAWMLLSSLRQSGDITAGAQLDASLPLHWETYRGLVFLYVGLFTPASIWIMRGFFVSIPRELEDAAVIDGCSRFGAFVRIVLPLAAPGIVATATFVFLLAWDELFFAWVLTSSAEVQTIPVGIRLFVNQFQHRYDLMMAAGAVSTLPVLLAFFAGQRWFVRGLAAGAIKG